LAQGILHKISRPRYRLNNEDTAKGLKQLTFKRKLLFILLFSLADETLQYVLAIGISDITDLITNTAGGFVGLAVYEFAKKFIASKKLDRILVVGITVLLLVFLGFIGVLYSRALRYQ